MQGVGIEGALVKIVEWPQYNATTAPDGTYAINEVPVGTYNISAWAQGYVTNTSPITVLASPAVTGKDFILSPNAKMVGINWITSYNNGIVTSTMASQLPRSSDVGTEFSGQYDTRKDAAGYFTAILVSDVSGTGANLNIDFLQEDGTPYTSFTNQPVPVNGTYTLFPQDSGLLLGKVVIKSTNPVVAEKRIVVFPSGSWNARGIMSILMPEKSSAATDFFGQYDSRKDTAGFFTVILVSDVYGTGSNVTINYLNDDGTLYSTEKQPIPKNGTYTIFPGNSGLLIGKVTINSTYPVVAEKRIVTFTPGTWNAFDIMSDSMLTPSDASKELIVPIYDGRKDILGWFSVVLLSDIYGTGANVTIDYLYLNGTLYNRIENMPVPINGTLTLFPGFGEGLSNGKMLIHSDNPIVGEERVVNYAPGTWNSRAIMSYNLLKETDALNNLVVPQYDSSGEWDAEVVVSAVNGASSPVLDYFSGTGTLNHTEYYDIAANGSYVFYPGDITMGRLEVGKVTVK